MRWKRRGAPGAEVTIPGRGEASALPGLGLALATGGCWFTPVEAGDFTEPAPERLEALAASLGLPGRSFARSRQVHGAGVRVVRGPADARPGEEYDGQVTGSREVICAVRVADCLPVALFSASAAGMVHAGWRGLAAGVLEAGVEAVLSLGPGPVTAVIGPGAGPCCYEAGEEVHRAFAALGPQARAGDSADLPWIAGEQLRRLGVPVEARVGGCTICSTGPAWHSHRREGEKAGRSLALAWRS